MTAITDEADPAGLAFVVVTGFVLLLVDMAQKLPRNTRALLISLSLVMGGTAIGLMLYNNLEGLALVSVFVLGIVIGLIYKM